jgi:plastocyanin
MKLHLTFLRSCIAAGILAAVSLATAYPQVTDVQARVELLQGKAQKAPNRGNVVLWLTPEPGGTGAIDTPVTPGQFRVEQKNKNFNPHLLVVPLGSTVEFPNLDPFFHNVFSQFNGKRFDLGLYEAGSTRVVHFDHEGVSFLFCNIHSEMAAVIVTVRTPYYATATPAGAISVHDVPDGDYEMHLWAEGADPKELQELSRHVHIGPSQRDLGTVRVYVTGSLADHKNKFGEDYRPDPTPSY